MRMRSAQLALLVLALLLIPLILQAQGERVELLLAEGVIDPIMSRFVARGIAEAERAGAQCLIIQLDTPGGLDSAMREIVQKIMGARVPVVVYVAPEGARAASAGVFITLAAHVAAMAPATDIGAAHPVSLEGEMTETMETKVVNEAASYIRTIAERRGRNVQWAEDAVRKSLSLTAQEALEQDVIDLIAADLDELLQKLDGREVETAWGRAILKTAGAEVRRIEMSLPERFIHRIIDPNIAYILFTLGVWGIIAEFYNPGAILPGLVGAILLILAFIAFGSLPVNWGGLALIILAVILFILDIKVSGFILSVIGGIAFVLGSLLLFRPFGVPAPAMPQLAVNPWLVAGTTLAFGAFFIFVIAKVVQVHRARVMSGLPRVIGAQGLAVTDLTPRGIVWADGEEWTAEALDPPIAKGEEVKIVQVDGLLVKVERVKRR
ncbi:MAG: NfeD family protein [Candidatus Bipolaricaulia bacterium]